MTKGQYLPVQLKQARLVSVLLYGSQVVLDVQFAGFQKKKKNYTAYDRFYRNDLNGKILAKKEPIRTFGITSRLLSI